MSDKRISVGDGNIIHVHKEDDADWSVWLNTETQDYDGLCIGCGDTEAAALEDAQNVLIDAVTAVQKERRR